MAPPSAKAVTGEFHCKEMPHSCARSTIFWWSTVRRTPTPLAPEKLASTEVVPFMKRVPRKACPSPGQIAAPSSPNASSVFGINPSPQALSIGGFAPSATVTSKPFLRAAMAAANPAGPPPMTSTPALCFTKSPRILDCLRAFRRLYHRLDVETQRRMPGGVKLSATQAPRAEACPRGIKSP